MPLRIILPRGAIGEKFIGNFAKFVGDLSPEPGDSD
jgi:hypothetical protein